MKWAQRVVRNENEHGLNPGKDMGNIHIILTPRKKLRPTIFIRSYRMMGLSKWIVTIYKTMAYWIITQI